MLLLYAIKVFGVQLLGNNKVVVTFRNETILSLIYSEYDNVSAYIEQYRSGHGGVSQ